MEPWKEQLLADVTERLSQLRKLNTLFEVAPLSCITVDSMKAMRSGMPTFAALLRRGQWRKIKALARLKAAYLLCRFVPALRVKDAWEEINR